MERSMEKEFLAEAAFRAKVQEKIDAIYQEGDDFKVWAHRITAVYVDAARELREAGVDKEILRRFLRDEIAYVNDHVTEYKDLTGVAVKAAQEYVALTEELYGREGLDAVEAWDLRAETFFMAECFTIALRHYEALIGFLEARPEFAPRTLAGARDTAGVCLMVLDRNEEAIDLLLKAYAFFVQDPVEYRSLLWGLCGRIAEVYYRLGDGKKMLAFYDLADKYDDK